MDKLNRFLESKRKFHGLSQDAVGKILGFSNGQYISNIERGECALPPKHFKKIAKLFNSDVRVMVAMALDDYEAFLKKELGIK